MGGKTIPYYIPYGNLRGAMWSRQCVHCKTKTKIPTKMEPVITLPSAPGAQTSNSTLKLSDETIGTFRALTAHCTGAEFDPTNFRNKETAILIVATDPEGRELPFWLSKPLSKLYYKGEINFNQLFELKVREGVREDGTGVRIICSPGEERIKIDLTKARAAAKPFKPATVMTEEDMKILCNVEY
jgi:hypothetical protein